MTPIQKITQYIADEQLLAPHDKIIVALSGGADSVALLRALLQLGYACEAAHCNFRLRGDESDRDEAFVTELCREQAVRLHVRHFDTAATAAGRHISIEMAARELRYDWFDALLHERHADAVAVAHHRDDSAETLLLNLLRGTGLKGLTGISPRNNRIVRPLLCIDRYEILDYLRHIGQRYVVDSTNLQDQYVRNKIRLDLLPLMETINPAVRQSLAQTAEHLRDALLIYNKGVDDARLRVTTPQGIRIAALLRETAPRTLLFELLKPLGFNSAQADDIFSSLTHQPGKVFQSSTHRIVKDREQLLVAPLPSLLPPTAPFRLEMREEAYTPAFAIPRNPDVACLDADKITAPIELRRWQHGDTFVPFGMTGQKKVSDYLTNRKFSLPSKENQWVACCNGKIVWLIGERVDNRFRIDKNTRRILIITRKNS